MIQKMAAFTDHFHQPQTGVQVFLVRIEMFNQIVDPGCPDGNLYLGRTGIARFGGISFDNFLFLKLTCVRPIPFPCGTL